MTPAISMPRRERSTATRSLLWRGSLTLMAMAYLVCAHLYTMGDPDLWGHLRFGLDMLQTRSLPTFDYYSFTAAGAPWINHEWLSELIFGLSWSSAGAAGLVWLKISLALITVGICFRHLRRQGVTPGFATTVMLTWILVIPTFSMIRPLHFTIPCFAALLAVLYEASEDGVARLWLLTPLFALWSNVHGGVLAGAAVLLLWWMSLLIADRPRFGSATTPVLFAIAAICLNPYGWHLLLFLLRTATVHRPEIIEWEPMRATSITGILYLAAAGLSVVGLLRSRLARRLPILIVFSAIVLLPFAAIRHGALGLVAIIILAGPHMADALRRQTENGRTRRSLGWQVPAWSFLVPLALTGLLCATVLRQTPVIEVPAAKYPVQAVRVLAASGIRGNLIHRFNWGEYILWHLSPNLRVMIDGRRETVYNPTLYSQYLDFQDGKAGWHRILDGHRADVALLEKDLVSASLYRLQPEWDVVYQDELAAIFVRKGSPSDAPLRTAVAQFRRTAQPYLFP